MRSSEKTVLPRLDHLVADNLSLKIATTPEEIIAAQELRYQVFYQEMDSVPTEEMRRTGREVEHYDPFCLHLLVIDNTTRKAVGTYRMLSLDDAQAQGTDLYTESEFDLSRLKSTSRRIMEVSRSCVLQEYRNRKVINLLWRGIAEMVTANGIDYLIGAPSLPGTDIATHMPSLSYLQDRLAPENIRPTVLEPGIRDIPSINREQVDLKRAFAALPPLLKGYLRLGALIGDGAFIDTQFNSIDVCIVVPMQTMDARYHQHYLTPHE